MPLPPSGHRQALGMRTLCKAAGRRYFIRGGDRMARNFKRTVLFCAVIGGMHATAFAQENVAQEHATPVPEQSAPEQSSAADANALDVNQATAKATDLDKVVVVGS